MKRRNTQFPFESSCDFLSRAWENGLLDEYSNKHFLIQAVNGKLNQFNFNKQFLNNNICTLYKPFYNADGEIDFKAFSENFCINLSFRLGFLNKIFGEKAISTFIQHQLAAGKNKYDENSFFQALSEIEILSFFHRGFTWDEIQYEPKIGETGQNPEAYFIGKIYDKETATKIPVKANIEVKTPAFPSIETHKEKFIIPAILLSEKGKDELTRYCCKNEIQIVWPRIGKLIDFFNSSVAKFKIPTLHEYNLLYINWSYSDFPINSFLEAFSLLTNQINGILTHKNIAEKFVLYDKKTSQKKKLSLEVFEKVTAVIIYTSSIEQLMFGDFRYVFQRNEAGCKFRNWIINESLRKDELTDKSRLLFNLTGMNPDKEEGFAFLSSSKDLPQKDMREIEKIILNNPF